METVVYILEDFRPDYDHMVIGVYSSFEKAKVVLIEILKESIMSCEDELNECEDEDEKLAEELRSSIDELKRMIKNVEKALPNPYYACGQIYITKHTIDL